MIKIHPTLVGMNQIAAQIANRLSLRTRSFKDGSGVSFTLPEQQAIQKMSSVFKVLITQKVYELAPKLRHENFFLELREEYGILFIPGARDF